MKWLRKHSAAEEPTASHCTCDIFDMGPRCDYCVASCCAKGHPLGTHTSGHPAYCFCGAPDGRYDALTEGER